MADASDTTSPAPPLGRWWHSFEEDEPGRRLYRPDGWDLPLARGRAAVEFRPDGTFVDWAIGRADANEARPGRWEQAADGTLHVLRTDGSRLTGRRDADALTLEPE